MKYCHVCIVCRDWKKISQFYQEVFGCRPIDPLRHNPHAGALLGIDEAETWGEHVMVPGYGDEGPTLEIMSIDPKGRDDAMNAYDLGFTHICFEMDDIRPTLRKLLDCGGSILSKWEEPFEARVVYCRDPEGNIVELRRPNPVPDVLRGRR